MVGRELSAFTAWIIPCSGRACSDIESGLRTGDLVNQSVPSTTLSSRGRVAKTPRSGEVLCCLAGFLGESRDSGFRLGLDARADNGISSGASRTVRGKSRDPLPFSRSGLIMGDFLISLCSQRLALEPSSHRIVRASLTGGEGIGKTSRV